ELRLRLIHLARDAENGAERDVDLARDFSRAPVRATGLERLAKLLLRLREVRREIVIERLVVKLQRVFVLLTGGVGDASRADEHEQRGGEQAKRSKGTKGHRNDPPSGESGEAVSS